MEGSLGGGNGDSGRWTIQAETLLQVAGLLNSSLERDQVLGTLAEQFLKIVSADWVVVAELYQAADSELRVVAGSTDGNPGSPPVRGTLLPFSPDDFLGRALTSREPVWSEIAAGASQREAPLAPHQAASALAVPLLFRGSVLGILISGWRSPVPGPSSKEVRLIQGLADQAATAIENARLFAAVERRAAQVTALFEIGRDISAKLALTDILSSIVRKAQQLLDTDTSFLALLSPDAEELRMTAWVGLLTEAMRSLRLRRGQGLAGAVVRSGEPVIVEGYSPELTLTDWPVSAVQQEGLVSQIAVPLGDGTNLLGVLYIGNRHPSRFSPEDAQLLMTFAKQATIAIQNARLYEEAVSQRELAEAGRRRLQVIVDSMPEGVIMVEGPDGQSYAVNDAGRSLLGVGSSSDLRLDRASGALGMLMPEGLPYPWDQFPLARALERGEVVLGREAIIQRPDGSRIPVLINSAPFRDPEGRISGAVAVFQDISRSKEAEQLKDEFVSLVSHELRTPLTSIKGAARTLLRHHDVIAADTQLELLQDVDEEADRLYRLVENLLDFSRAEAGALHLSTEPVHLGKLVARVMEEMSAKAVACRFETHIPPGILPVEADPVRVEQVLRNLLDNAVKYSPEGGLVDITLESGDGVVRVAARDRGLGISREDQERVFERFQRRAAPGVAAQGVGLGLAICRRLVEAHGGSIWVESQPGVGSTFYFTLPVVQEALDE